MIAHPLGAVAILLTGKNIEADFGPVGQALSELDGLVLLMAAKFVGVRFSQALRAALPIYAVFFVTIAFAIYFPSVVLWLPKQVIPASVGCFKAPDGPGYICPK